MTKWSYDAQKRTGRLELSGALTIVRAEQVKESLLKGFAAAEQLVCDLAGISEIDIAGLQLLCAAHRYAVAQGKTLLLSGIGTSVDELARQAGFVRGLHGDLC